MMHLNVFLYILNAFVIAVFMHYVKYEIYRTNMVALMSKSHQQHHST